jgi:hypothetical protein
MIKLVLSNEKVKVYINDVYDRSFGKSANVEIFANQIYISEQPIAPSADIEAVTFTYDNFDQVGSGISVNNIEELAIELLTTFFTIG